MPIPNLKQILESDSQQERLDKINYNFDQLVANGGGPMGSTGPIGETGMQGVTGDQGPQGASGDQGTQGPINTAVSNFWKDGAVYTASGLNIQTIVPVDTISSTQNDHSPTVLLGFTTDYPEYGDIQNSSSAIYKAQLVVNKNDQYVDANIRLVSNNSQGIYADFDLTEDTYFDAGYGNSLSRYNLNIGFNESVGIQKNINYKADSFKFKDLNDNDMLTMDANDGALFTGNFVSTGSAHFVGSIFKIDIGPSATPATDPAAGKIAVSLDGDGTIGFKLPEEIGAGIPIGTIISFLPSIYEDPNNFIQSQDISADINNGTNPDNIEIEIGAGIAGTEYEGWYLCNGETWVGQNGESYTVPNLNSFNYSITTPDGNITSGPVALNVLGGSYATMNQNSSTLTDTYVTGDELVGMADASDIPEDHIAYKIVRTPQLIYLGLPGFYFKAAGAPPVTIDFFSATKSTILAGGSNDPENGGTFGWQRPSIAPVNGQYEFVSSQTRMETTSPADDGILTKLLGNRILSVEIMDDDESSFATADGIGSHTLEYGQDAIITIRVKGKPWHNNNSDNDTNTNPTLSNYNSLDHYSWFVNWNEYRLPNPSQPTSTPYTIPSPAFITGTWNDRGTFSTGATYVTGDVFYYADGIGYNETGHWYTINPILTSVSQASVTDIHGNTVGPSAAYPNPIGARLAHSSWTGISQLGAVEDYFVRLPDSRSSGSDYQTVLYPSAPFNPEPNPSGGGMKPENFEGCYDSDRTGNALADDEWYDSEAAEARIYPPAMTLSTGDSLVSRKGIFTQPMQVAIDPVTNNGESAADQILLPVITTCNLSEIQSQYPDLGIQSSDVVQYLDPYTYDEGNDHWRAVQYLSERGTNGVTTEEGPYKYGFAYSGGYEEVGLQGGYNVTITGTGATSSGPIDVFAWRYGQQDTMFRRYQTIEFKVVLDSTVVDQILNYNATHPGEDIALLLGHYLYAPGGENTDSSNASDWATQAPGNVQPLGGNNKKWIDTSMEGELEDDYTSG